MKDYIEFQRKISKGGGTSTSYRITVPEEIINKMEVMAGDKITWRIYDKSNEITILFPKEPTQKQTKTRDKEIFQSVLTDNKKYTIELLNNPYLRIRVNNNNTQKQVTTLGASKREKSQIQSIITLLKPCKTEDEIKKLLDKYRK